MPYKAAVSKYDRISLGVIILALLVNFIPPTSKLKLTHPLAETLLLPNRAIAFLKTFIAANRNLTQRLTQIACELAVENARLKSTRNDTTTISLGNTNLLSSQVIARDMNTLKRFLLLNRGTVHKIQIGATAITPEGIVGRIIAASPHQSLVQTILEPGFRIAVLNSRNGELAICRPKYNNEDLLVLDYVNPNADFKIGDTILSSGLGGIFPKGLKIGIVIETPAVQDVFKKVFVKPFVTLSRVENIYIIVHNPYSPDTNSSLEGLPFELNLPE